MQSATLLTAAAVVLPDNATISDSDNNEKSVLDRRSSIDSNVLCIDNTQYFWLQRKIRTTESKGSVRIGFCLKVPASKKSQTHPDDVWEVMVTPPKESNSEDDGITESQFQMVAICVENTIDFLDSMELAALNFVSSNSTITNEHIQSTLLFASDSSKIYIVMPYEDAISMTLSEYCVKQPGSIVVENKAREFIQQILRVSLSTPFVH
jgi:hypothetical protein